MLQRCHHWASQISKIGWVGREKQLSCSKTGKGRKQRNTFSSPAMTPFPAVPFRKTLAAGSGALSLAHALSTCSRWRGLAQDSTLNPAVVSRETNHPFLINLQPKLGVAGPEVKSTQHTGCPYIALEVSHKHRQPPMGLLSIWYILQIMETWQDTDPGTFEEIRDSKEVGE